MKPLLQPLQWSLERVVFHGVEGVAVGTGWCHKGRPAMATYLETPHGGKNKPRLAAKGEGRREGSPEPGASNQGEGGTQRGKVTLEETMVPGGTSVAKRE